MTKLHTFGCPFRHTASSCHGYKPSNFEWVHDTSNNSVEVYMDDDLLGGFKSKCKNKFLWLVESKEIIPEAIEYVKTNFTELAEVYRKIFINDREVLKLDSVFEYCPPGSNLPWVTNKAIHTKTKLISMISSNKAITTGHKYRNFKIKEFIEKGYPIDFFGRQINPIVRKEDALEEYRFSIAMENAAYTTYYTEKIMDCFATGTIPIYYGTPDIGDHFNKDGIIVLDDNFNIYDITVDLYHSKKETIKENFERCMETISADDYIYQKIIQLI